VKTPRPSRAWPTPPLTPAPSLPPLAGREDVDTSWRPLRQAWRTRPSPQFQPAWARVRWHASGLLFDVLLVGAAPANRAAALNQPTWELGDVCEIFLRVDDQPQYFELHVTPENQRLQLRWPAGGIARVRSGAARLEEFAVPQPDWVHSATRVAAGAWSAQVLFPAQSFGVDSLTPAHSIHTAVCRYDYHGRPLPVLSSTAPFRAPSFHRPLDWDRLVLQ